MQSALILEDHPDSRAWLEQSLAEAFPGIAIESVDSLARGRAALLRTRFDLALLDINLPDGSGVSLLEEIQRSSASTYVVITTIYDDDEHLFGALQNGAQGFLLKDQPRERLAEQLKGIARGVPPLSPSIARRVLRYFRSEETVASVPAKVISLTDREGEVLRLLANGYTRGDISRALEITDNTVAAHTKQIYRKLNVSGRAEAALEAVRLGVVDVR